MENADVTCMLSRNQGTRCPQLRGIAVAPLLCRVYGTIMDNRFRCWFAPNPEQSGFRAKQGCLLPLFALIIMIIFCKENKRNLFVGFLDFEKAFDYVNRAQLLRDLMSKGCGTRYLRPLSKMYTESFYAPKISETQLGEPIRSVHGVAQGRRSSTNYFSFFVSDMPTCLKDLNTNDFLDPYNLLQLADDTLTLADKYDSLVQKLLAMFLYSKRKYQAPNVKKTLFAHFSSTPIVAPMLIGDTYISSIDEKKGHVYLGMIFLPTDDFEKILLANINSRMKHVAKYYAWLEINENTPIETKLLVLDNCVFSALLYGCETWGDITCIESRLIQIESKLLKRVLNIKKGTTNDIIFYELRRASIVAKIKDKQYSFFQKCLNFSDNEAVITQIIRMCRRCSILDHYFSLRGNSCAVFLNDIDEKVRLDDSSMIMYYRNLVVLEKSCIYNSFINDYFRKIITRWRLSNHKLKIETGRYSRPVIPREDRICSICFILEDEHHAVFVCPAYESIRSKYYRLFSNNNDITSILSPSSEFIIETAQLLYDIEQIRKDLSLQS